MKKNISWFVVAVAGMIGSQACAGIVLRAASTGSEGNTRYTDYAPFDIDGSGGVTNAGDPTYRDFDVTGSITNADAFNNSFNMNWGAMGAVNTNAGENFGAMVTKAGIDRANAGDLGVRGGVSTGIDQNEGYFFGLDLSNFDSSLSFRITKVAFSTMSNLGAEQVTFVNRNDTSKTLVVDSNPTNPNVDVSALDLTVRGGTSDSELLSVFNSSATVQSWRIISLEIEVISTPPVTVVLRSAGTGSEGDTRYTDTSYFDIDAAGGVTNAGDIAYRDFNVTGGFTNALTFNQTFGLVLSGMSAVDTSAGAEFGALSAAGGIDRSTQGDLGIRGNLGNGLDVNEGYLVGLDLSNLDPHLVFQITKVAFSTMSNLGAEQATFVNRNDTGKTLVVDSDPINPNVDVSALDLTVRGGTSDNEVLSVFNTSSTTQSWRIISFEIAVFSTTVLPATSANLAISSDGTNVTIVATGVTAGSQNQLQRRDVLGGDGSWGAVDVPKSGDTTHTWVIPATNSAAFYNVNSYNE